MAMGEEYPVQPGSLARRRCKFIQTLQLFQSSAINEHTAGFPGTPPVMLQWDPEPLPLSRDGHLNMHLTEVGGAYESSICLQPRMDGSEWKALDLFLYLDDGVENSPDMLAQAWLYYLENVAPWPSQGADHM